MPLCSLEWLYTARSHIILSCLEYLDTDFVKTFSIVNTTLESLDLNNFLAKSCDDKDYCQTFLLRGLCPFLNLK